MKGLVTESVDITKGVSENERGVWGHCLILIVRMRDPVRQSRI